MSVFDVTYTQERGPAAIDFEEYSKLAMAEYHTLLETNPLEPAVQDFLERHPSMVPGAWTPGTKSGHGPLYHALITQPTLPGFGSRIPDFMWLSNHSGAIYAAIVEIERPGKRLFTRSGTPTAEFAQAYNQLTQWRVWFDSPANKQSFLDHYGISEQLRSKMFDLHLIMVFGRRSEFNDSSVLSKHRGFLTAGRNEELMSFDRLQPDPTLHNVVTVSPLGNAIFSAKYVPDTFVTSPFNAHDLKPMRHLANAIDRNHNISPERRTFLKRRVVYWVAWANKTYGECCIDCNAFHE